jgi:hypothetical protein
MRAYFTTDYSFVRISDILLSAKYLSGVVLYVLIIVLKVDINVSRCN